MKVAIVVGHNSKGKGAYSKHLDVSEYDFFSEVASIIKKNAPSVDIFKREDVGSYTKEMKKVIDEINKRGYDLVLELHYNSFNGEASGVEMLHYHKSSKGIEYSEALIKIHELVCGLKKRRLIPVSDSSQNGSYGILNSKMPYVLTESFFGDNASDCSKVSAKKLAIVFLLFLYSVGVEVKQQEAPSPETPPTSIPTIVEAITEIQKQLEVIKDTLNNL